MGKLNAIGNIAPAPVNDGAKVVFIDASLKSLRLQRVLSLYGLDNSNYDYRPLTQYT
jgi:hypothetical protein